MHSTIIPYYRYNECSSNEVDSNVHTKYLIKGFATNDIAWDRSEFKKQIPLYIKRKKFVYLENIIFKVNKDSIKVLQIH